MKVVDEVKLELREMRRIGSFVPAEAFLVAEDDAVEMYQNGMSISAIADYCIDMSHGHDSGIEVDCD